MAALAVACSGGLTEAEKRSNVGILLAQDGRFEEAVPGSHWIDPRTDEFVRGEEVPRLRDLDVIPSPYRDGWMDPYYDSAYFPILQIARGCPFT